MWMIQLTLLFLMPDQFTVHVIPQFNVVVQESECPVMYVTSADFHCPACKVLERDIENGVFSGITIRKAPRWDSMTGFPSIRFQNSKKSWKSVTGYDSRTRDFLLRTLLPSPQQQPTSSGVSRRMTHSEMVKLHDSIHNAQSGLSTHWTYPGTIESHLSNVHGVKTFTVEIKK